MLKNVFRILIIFVFAFLFVGSANAAGSLLVRIEEPKSPTNQDNYKINFVTLDIQGRPITAKCLKKGPSDAGFSQFGPDIAIAAGGGTNNCQVDSSIMNTNGTYQFYVSTQAGSDTAPSVTVSVDFNTSGPGTPTNYSKEQISSCVYRIKFRTADDGGKTVKVELYRSDSTSFSVDSGTRVDTISIASNTDGQFENTVPDCNKTYYFALRAFDSTGNGSGVVSDSVVTIVTTTVVTTVTPAGAIPVVTSAVGEVLGTKEGKEGVLGEATPSGKPTISSELSPEVSKEAPKEEVLGRFSSRRNLAVGIVVILILFAAYLAYRRFRK